MFATLYFELKSLGGVKINFIVFEASEFKSQNQNLFSPSNQIKQFVVENIKGNFF